MKKIVFSINQKIFTHKKVVAHKSTTFLFLSLRGNLGRKAKAKYFRRILKMPTYGIFISNKIKIMRKLMLFFV